MSTRDLTEGSVPRLLVALSVPVIVSTSLQSLYALVGLFWVGLLGDAAVAALSIGLQVFFVVLALAQVLATTALADMSQDWGASRRERAGGVLSAYLVVGAVVGAAATVAAWFAAPLYVGAFTTEPAVVEQGVAYFRASAPSFLTQLLLLLAIQGLRAAGDFTSPVRVSLVTVALNLVLDPLLMFGGAGWPGDGALAAGGRAVTGALGLGGWSGLGIAGAGIATTICQLVALVWLGAVLLRPKAELRLRRPLFSAALLRGIVVRGLPAGLQFLLLAAVLGLLLAAMRPFGAEWTAAAGGGFRIFQQLVLPCVATGTAAAALAGQNAGAGRFDRVAEVVRTAAVGLGVYAVLGALALTLFAGELGRLFTSGDLHASEVYFRWSAWSLVGFGVGIVPAFVLQALKRPGLPLVGAGLRIGLLAAVALGVGPALGWGPEAVFGASTLGSFVEGGFNFALAGVAIRSLARRRAAG